MSKPLQKRPVWPPVPAPTEQEHTRSHSGPPWRGPDIPDPEETGVINGQNTYVIVSQTKRWNGNEWRTTLHKWLVLSSWGPLRLNYHFHSLRKHVSHSNSVCITIHATDTYKRSQDQELTSIFNTHFSLLKDFKQLKKQTVFCIEKSDTFTLTQCTLLFCTFSAVSF